MLLFWLFCSWIAFTSILRILEVYYLANLNDSMTRLTNAVNGAVAAKGTLVDPAPIASSLDTLSGTLETAFGLAATPPTA